MVCFFILLLIILQQVNGHFNGYLDIGVLFIK